MTNLLLRIFVKDHESTTNPKVREDYGKLGSTVGILCNILLFLGKFIIGTVFNSVSIVADAVNNLSDAGSSVVTFIGFKLSSKPADEDHPFGHARIEYISALIVAFLILLLGVELVKTSIDKVLHPSPMSISGIMVIILIASILVKFWMSFFNRNLGNKINSTAMKATATDSMNDVIATSAVLISVAITHFTGFQVDGYAGVAVAIFILYSGINLIKETVNPLLGEAPTSDLVASLEGKILAYSGVLGIHDLVVHSYGPNKWFASVHVEVSAKEDILESHDMIDNIERDVSELLGVNLVIHLDPIVVDDEAINAIRSFVMDVVHNIHPTLSIHDFRLVMGSTHTNLIFDVSVPAGFHLSNKELEYLISTKIQEEDSTYYAVITFDNSYVTTHFNKVTK
ncbi:MAG: cation diffusion facilitator family transporter [Cellulosilyticaceae bacterium]